jgi:hypothetical protein
MVQNNRFLQHNLELQNKLTAVVAQIEKTAALIKAIVKNRKPTSLTETERVMLHGHLNMQRHWRTQYTQIQRQLAASAARRTVVDKVIAAKESLEQTQMLRQGIKHLGLDPKIVETELDAAQNLLETTDDVHALVEDFESGLPGMATETDMGDMLEEAFQNNQDGGQDETCPA